MSQKSIKFHLKSNDYFGTMAAILSLVRQSIDNKESNKINSKILSNLVKDLVYLQKEYKIVKK